jgi:hypothetical protein
MGFVAPLLLMLAHLHLVLLPARPFLSARTRNAKVFYPPLSSGARLRDNKHVTAAFFGLFLHGQLLCFFAACRIWRRFGLTK